MNWSQYAVVVTGLFAIMNPIGATPIFLELTDGQSVAERRQTAFTAALAVAVILIVSAWVGTYVFNFSASASPPSGWAAAS